MLVLILTSTNSFPLSSKALDIKISGSISETYDDNLTFDNDDKKEDFITTIGVGLFITHEGKKRTLSLSGNLNERFNARFSDIKNSSQSLNIVFNQEFSPYSSMRLTDNFSRSSFPSSFEEEFGRVTGRREAFNNRVNFVYNKNFSERLSMSSVYGLNQNFFSEDELIDSSQHSFGFNMGYQYGIAGTLSLSSSYTRNNFGNSIYNIGVGINQQVYITKKSYISGNVGLKGNSNDAIGLNMNVNYTTEIDERTRLSFNFNTSDQLTDESGDIFDSWRLNAKFSRDLSDKLAGFVTVNYAKGTFSSNDITDELLGSTSSIGYLVTESLRCNISYSLSYLDSTDIDREYTRNALSLQLIKTF